MTLTFEIYCQSYVYRKSPLSHVCFCAKNIFNDDCKQTSDGPDKPILTRLT